MSGAASDGHACNDHFREWLRAGMSGCLFVAALAANASASRRWGDLGWVNLAIACACGGKILQETSILDGLPGSGDAGQDTRPGASPSMPSPAPSAPGSSSSSPAQDPTSPVA